MTPDVQQDTPAPSRLDRRRSQRDDDRNRRRGVIAVIALVAAIAIAVVLIMKVTGSDDSSQSGSTQASGLAALQDPTDDQAFVAGAASDIAAVTSYSYRTLAGDLSNGMQVTTGNYRKAYRAALTGTLGATTKRLHRTQSFELRTAGIGTTSGDGSSATVLMFGTRSVSDDTTKGATRRSLITLTATVVRSGARYRISELSAGTNPGLPAGSDGLTSATEAAREEVTNLLTMRRAQAAADYKAALSLAVDPLRTQLKSQSASVRAAARKGRYDLVGAVTAIAVAQVTPQTVVLLVAATGRKQAGGKTSVVTDGRYQVTVVRVEGTWLVSAVNAVAV